MAREANPVLIVWLLHKYAFTCEEKPEAEGAELNQFVPSEVNTFQEVPAVAGIVAVDQLGKAPDPPLLRY